MAGVIKTNTFGDAFPVLVSDSSSDLVDLRGNAREYFQASLRFGRRSPVTGILHGYERGAAPGASYLGEKPVFDRVVLRTIRRVVHHHYANPELFGKIHEVLLHNVMTAGVGTSAIAEDDKIFCVLVHFGEVFIPESLHIVAYELGGVVAESYSHVADVVRHIIDAVRHNQAVGESGEIMVEALGCAETKHLPSPLEVADDLLFLGVNADYRDAKPDTKLNDVLYLDKLLIPALHAFQRDVLAERPFLEAAPFDKLLNVVKGDFHSSPGQLFPYPACVDVQPYDVLVHGVSGKVAGDNFEECCHPLGVPINLILRAASWHSLLAVRRRNVVGKFRNCSGNGIWGTPKSLAYSPYRAAHETHRLGGIIMSSIQFFKRFNELHYRFVILYWRFLLHFCKNLKINYKNTKISPVVCDLKC